MALSTSEEAKLEIDKTLRLCEFAMRRIGLSFEKPKTTIAYFRQKLLFIVSVCSICYHVFSEIVYIVLTLSNSPRVEDVVPLFHTMGFGALSIAKVFVLWYKKDVFDQLLYELAEIWPMPPLDKGVQDIKNTSLDALRITHQWYFYINAIGVWFYNFTPIVTHYYQKYINYIHVDVGYVWVSWYPFDKQQLFAHIVVYLFEVFAGVTCVWIMICSDLLFSAMASHIGLLLRILQRKLERIGTVEQTEDKDFEEIKENIKLHQRLIKYCNDLEDAFSLSNFANIVLSSVNICCVVFVIVLLEPLLVVNSKMFIISALIQIGMICWYADDIFHANGDVAKSAYNSMWYRTSPRCRKALLFLIKRAQKPIAFTAMKFTDISLVTYSAILTRSYSYFALLYTMYNEN